MEALGSADPAIDAEILQLYVELLRRVGVTEWELRLNSIGDENCRPAYVERLNAWLDAHPEALDEDALHKRRTSPLQVFDVKNPAVQAALADAPTIGESLCDACREHFDAVERHLDALGVPYTVTPTLVRGLDYYTRTTFEFVGPDETANSTICGGGRYDGLVEQVGGPPTPGIGFGAGLERLLLAIEREVDAAEPERLDVFLVADPGAERETMVRLLAAIRAERPLRRHGLRRPLAQGTGQARPAAQAARRRGRRRDRGAHRAMGRARPTTLCRSMQSSIESRTSSWRDLYCGDVRAEHVGRRVTVSGWADTRRDHGGLVFIDLRDHTGLLQLVANPEHAAEAAETAHEVRNEFVLRAEGEIVPRAPEAVNPNLPTGAVEVRLDRLEIVSRSTPLPFQLDEENVDEVLRLRYRWLDMRRGQMQRNLRINHVAIAAIRRTMDELGFVDVWTPSMTKGRRRAPATSSSRSASSPASSSRSRSRRSSSSSSA